MAQLPATALELKVLSVTLVGTLEQLWTVALSQGQSGWAAVYIGKHSSRVHSDGYSIPEDFVEYEPEYEAKGSI